MTLRRFRTGFVLLAAVSLALPGGALVLGDQPAQKQEEAKPGEAKPALPADVTDLAAPAAAAPKVTANVTPEAKQLIDQIDAAYAKVRRLELAGTYTADFDAGGQQIRDSKSFAATFAAPNKFRHAMQGDIVVGSTGEKAYAYLEDRKIYSQADAPKEKPQLQQMPEPLPRVIQMQNPALMLALVNSAAAELSGMFSDIKKLDDSKLPGDGTSYPTLQLTLPNRMVVTMLFDPRTHLLRQARTDVKPMLEERGTPQVKGGTMVVDYTTVKVDDAAKVLDEQFAWAPPQGAKELTESMAQSPAGGSRPAVAAELEGKPAPAFALKDIEGRTVSLKDLHGKVVVLDLWATWCPPCRASLPYLDKLHEETKDKGVAVFAVNLQEDKEDVKAFIEQTNLKSPVLLDTDGSVATAYKAEAIPQTIVIARDGTVFRVFRGFEGEPSAQELKQAVEQALR